MSPGKRVDPGGGGEGLTPEQLRDMVRELSRGSRRALSSDVVEDCYLEALLLLWRLRDRLRPLALADRQAYARTRARHLVVRILKREFQHQSHTVPVESPERLEQDRGALHFLAEEQEPEFAEGLLGHVHRPDLAAALSALAPGDYEILDLFYARDQSDAEIAQRLDVPPETAKKRRLRALARLRRGLARGSPDPH